jgi:hypothetical protein
MSSQLLIGSKKFRAMYRVGRQKKKINKSSFISLLQLLLDEFLVLFLALFRHAATAAARWILALFLTLFLALF